MESHRLIGPRQSDRESGQIFVEGVLWIFLISSVVLLLSAGFRHEYLLYKNALSRQSGLDGFAGSLVHY